MRPRDPFTVGLVLVLYVLPLGAAAVLLALAGLPLLALALLVVEAVVATAVIIAKRPQKSPSAPRPGWAVGVAIVLVLTGLVGLTLLAAAYG